MALKHFFFTLILLLCFQLTEAQTSTSKPVYHPCFLMDSVDKHLEFIRINSSRVFADTLDCKDEVLKKIAERYIETKSVTYLNALSSIRQNPNAKVEEFYTDVVKLIIENDFGGFVENLYSAKGKLYPLEKELITTLNMIVDGRMLKQKYFGLLNVEISKAKDKKDTYKEAYLNKLKSKIENEKF
jgi:hypothetical protein